MTRHEAGNDEGGRAPRHGLTTTLFDAHQCDAQRALVTRYQLPQSQQTQHDLERLMARAIAARSRQAPPA
jgi:hypothetical protein